MKSQLIATVVVAAAAFSSASASAQVFNSWLFDQAQTSSTQTRAEVKNEVKAPRHGQAGISGIGALTQPDATRSPQKTAESPSASLVKTSSQ